MPEGVEHSDVSKTLLTTAPAIDSVMPEGVEHFWQLGVYPAYFEAIDSVMPEGVEHTSYYVTSGDGTCDRLGDAGRR